MEEPLMSLQKQVREWTHKMGNGYFSELTNMAILSEEVGEVARIMARRYGDQVEKPGDLNKDLGEELCDVLFVLLCLADQTGTDLDKAWADRMKKKTERDQGRWDRPVS